ncbi:hypothetical protein Droror1_Dr00023033 [Drosera rotundifolia]
MATTLPLQSSNISNTNAAAAAAALRAKTIEETYQKKSQLEHILLLPDTYIGLIEKHTQKLWVYESDAMVHRYVTQRSVRYNAGEDGWLDELQGVSGVNLQYLLPKEEKVSKPVEEVKVESPVSMETPGEEVVLEEVEASVKEVAPEEVDASVKEIVTEEAEAPVAAEEGNEAPADVAIDSSDLETAPADFRFPTTNQTRHCFTRYNEYHRCIAAKGEDAPECNRFAKYY